jgi:serine/threonine protein phosphatase PrpC
VTVLRSGSATDVGRVRKVNEDLPLEATNLYAVADGMGGHVGGEVAARVAIEALEQTFTREPTTGGLRAAFSSANRAVWQESQDNSSLRGMGTTLTAMALVGGPGGRDTLALANVGDSRAYLYSEGRITQVTADHSLAEERMRQGEITAAEAAVHPQRHILTRAMGIASDVEPDMWELQLRAGDRMVLCSDGLSNEIEPEELAAVLSAEPDPHEAAQRLVEVANHNGGADNITVVVVDVLVGEDEAEAASASVVTPIGTPGSPMVVAAGAVAAADHLARGAQLGFTSQMPALGQDDPRTGEFFRGESPTGALSRTTVRAAAATRSNVAPVPANETRRQRRRRLGVPRRITLRVVLFILLVAAIPTGAYFAIRWYAYDNWVVVLQGKHVVIKQGRTGGVLWFNPKVVDHTAITTSGLLPANVTDVRSGVQEPTLQDAKRYASNLHEQYEFLKTAAAKEKKERQSIIKNNSTTTTGPPASGTIPTTTPTTAVTATTAAATAATVAVTTPTTAQAGTDETITDQTITPETTP